MPHPLSRGKTGSSEAQRYWEPQKLWRGSVSSLYLTSRTMFTNTLERGHSGLSLPNPLDSHSFTSFWNIPLSVLCCQLLLTPSDCSTLRGPICSPTGPQTSDQSL